MKTAEIVFIGHSTRDEITIRGETSYLPGGGVYFGAASAGWCLRKHTNDTSKHLLTLTIGNDPDFTRIRSELEAAGTKLDLIQHPCTTTFIHSFENDDPDKRISSVGDVARPFTWDDIKDYHGKVFYVNPLFFGEIDPSLFKLMKQNCETLVVDSQGLIRHRNQNKIYHKAPENLGEMIEYVDLLKVDTTEAASLTGLKEDQKDDACKILLSKGPKYIMCTESAGCTFYLKDGSKYWAPFERWTLDGRTGRGDTILAAFCVCHFALGMNIQESLNIAANGCSKKMQHAGAAVKEDFE